jgi:hypothetical protein
MVVVMPVSIAHRAEDYGQFLTLSEFLGAMVRLIPESRSQCGRRAVRRVPRRLGDESSKRQILVCAAFPRNRTNGTKFRTHPRLARVSALAVHVDGRKEQTYANTEHNPKP